MPYNLKTFEECIAEEGFLDRFKRKKSSPVKSAPVKQMPEVDEAAYMEAFEKTGRKHVSAMQSLYTKIAKDPKHKLAAKGFSKPPIDLYMEDGVLSYVAPEQYFRVEIVVWDLWDIYPDARSRASNDDIKEYLDLYNALSNAFRDYLSKNNLPGKIDEGGDWDTGMIEWEIPYSEIGKICKVD